MSSPQVGGSQDGPDDYIAQALQTLASRSKTKGNKNYTIDSKGEEGTKTLVSPRRRRRQQTLTTPTAGAQQRELGHQTPKEAPVPSPFKPFPTERSQNEEYMPSSSGKMQIHHRANEKQGSSQASSDKPAGWAQQPTAQQRPVVATPREAYQRSALEETPKDNRKEINLNDSRIRPFSKSPFRSPFYTPSESTRESRAQNTEKSNRNSESKENPLHPKSSHVLSHSPHRHRKRPPVSTPSRPPTVATPPRTSQTERARSMLRGSPFSVEAPSANISEIQNNDSTASPLYYSLTGQHGRTPSKDQSPRPAPMLMGGGIALLYSLFNFMTFFVFFFFARYTWFSFYSV